MSAFVWEEVDLFSEVSQNTDTQSETVKLTPSVFFSLRKTQHLHDVCGCGRMFSHKGVLIALFGSFNTLAKSTKYLCVIDL